MYETASPTGYGLILALLVVLAGGAIVLGEEYWSETHTPQNGTVEAKSYDAPKSRLLSSRDEVYRLKISNGDKEGDVKFPATSGSRPRSATGTTQVPASSRKPKARPLRKAMGPKQTWLSNRTAPLAGRLQAKAMRFTARAASGLLKARRRHG